MASTIKTCFFFSLVVFFQSCTDSSQKITGRYDFQLEIEENTHYGLLRIDENEGQLSFRLQNPNLGSYNLENIKLAKTSISGEFYRWRDTLYFEGQFSEGDLTGRILEGEVAWLLNAKKQSEESVDIDRSGISYLLSSEAIEEEGNIDHAGIIEGLDLAAYRRGARLYNSNCINCHGNPEMEGSIPLSNKFWSQKFKAGSDAYSMYETISRGFGAMPPQPNLTPQQKYDVISYIQETFVRGNESETLVVNSPGYLKSLPTGTDRGPEAKPYHPWKDMDYGNFFINTYELVDKETGIPRYHSPGPSPFPDEDYSKNNFAYKGIAVRLDTGAGGVSEGKVFMIFDHDVMRVAGGWSGGFIDWDGILLNDRHETYPRTVGKLHFETPVGPGWANPETGSFEDTRWRARDGRAFGPLPKKWADYEGIYHYEDHIVISYKVDGNPILEELGMAGTSDNPVFTRTMNISSPPRKLKMRIAADQTKVGLVGNGATIRVEDGYHILETAVGMDQKVKIFISGSDQTSVDAAIENSSDPEDLSLYTKGGPSHFPEVVAGEVLQGLEDGPFAIDRLLPPITNPWNARLKLSGIDFMSDANKAVLCTTDGDIWMVSGLLNGGSSLEWKRIGSGLFQPLGIKVLNDEIFIICRDQLVRLQDFNGDGDTDFYESFNHDHQVSDHFHEFAMGLQADQEGNLYYAKSGRHAREALIPQHGTLLKVSKDGSSTEIIATGFRAANGVCINPDGSFIVTDQQGYWNPMNRLNWVEVDGEAKFYGNMWGYNPPDDSSDEAMEPPMVWVDMEYDRSPSELVWVNSKAWGPLDGKLLSFSYGYGKIQLVLNEEVNGQRQGGVIDLPGVKFLTGVMRGRFNPADGQLYACGMSAWGTNQLMKGGGFYRVRYTGKTLPIPVELKVLKSGLELDFSTNLDPSSLVPENFIVKTWDIERSRRYGSDRFNITELTVDGVVPFNSGRSLKLMISDITQADIMTITYELMNSSGERVEGSLQNTIHNLRSNTGL